MLIEGIKKKIKELKLENNVMLLGNIDYIPSILSALDIFLFPSLYEGFPNAVSEAQTSGVPCLISNTITNEVVITPHCVTLDLNLSSKIWAEELLKLDYKINRELGATTGKDKGFSVENEINKIQEIYEELIN